MEARMYSGKLMRANKGLSMIALLVGFVLIVVMEFASAASFQSVSVVSPVLGAPAGGDGDSLSPVVSGDERYVLFSSSANDLVLTRNNTPIVMRFPPKMNVYVRDRTNGTTSLVSLAFDGTNGADGDSFPVDISTNGQFVLFESSAANLVFGTTNGSNNIYLRDLAHGTTVLVSVNTNYVGGNGSSQNSAMTPDGRFVVFASAASDLTPADTNGISDVFVRDMQLNVTTLVSQGAQGNLVAGSDLPDITPDGRYVVFYSMATNLVSGVATSGEVYIRDLGANSTVWASAYAHTAVQQQYNSANSLSLSPTISDDGQFVAYEAICSTSSTSNGIILRYSQLTGITDLIATNASSIVLGSELNHRNLDMTPDGRYVAYATHSNYLNISAIYRWDSWSNNFTSIGGTNINSIFDTPVMSPDGRFISFVASAYKLTTNTVQTNNGGFFFTPFHLYQTDMASGTTRLLDAETNGVASGGFYSLPSMSSDGTLIAFETQGASFLPQDNNNAHDVIVANLSANTLELISCAHPDLPSLTPNGPSTLFSSSVSSNARYIVFSSEASNLVPNDTNGYRDVFIRDAWLGSNTLVSVGRMSSSANGYSSEPAITPDGRYVAFTSTASNFYVGIVGVNYRNVYWRDMLSNVTMVVSSNFSNTGYGNADSYSASISTNGRYLLFHSIATNLAGNIITTNSDNVFWRDMQARITTQVFTTNTSSTPAAGAMTPDGRYVAAATIGKPLYIWETQLAGAIYTNTLTDGFQVAIGLAISPDGTRLGLVGGASSSSLTVYALDRIANTSVTLGPGLTGPHYVPSFSANSRYMAYVGVTNRINQVNLYDFQTGTNLLISQSTNGIPGNTNSDSPNISSDGRYIAYRSLANNLGPGATNGLPNLYLYDSVAATTTLLSGNTPLFGRSLTPVFSGDGQTLVFASWDDGFAAQDFNQWSDILALDLSDTNVQPAFMAIILPGAQGQPPVINWPTTSGKHYQVQFKNQLSDPVWQVLNGSVLTSGNQQSLTDPAPPIGQRFYRVVSY